MEQLLTAEQVADLVGVARSTIYAWIRRGLFPEGATLGPKLRRWRRDDIENWQRDSGLTQPADQ